MGQNSSGYSSSGGYDNSCGSGMTGGRGGQPHHRHSWTSGKYNNPHVPMLGARTTSDGNHILPISFHQVHGKHIQLSEDGKLASRVGSFCNAIAFTNRPISINEEVHMELVHSTNSWSGVLRFGFTQHNPARISLDSLPKYACPDLTVKSGYWAKALRETYAENGNILSFYCNEYGQVHFKMDNSGYQPFFSDVDASNPIWALVDVYGNTTGVRLKEINQTIPTAISDIPPILANMEQQRVDDLGLPNDVTNQNTANNFPMQTDDTSGLERLHFHDVHGSSVRLRSHNKQARRKIDSYRGGLVFSERPLRIGEEIFIKIIEVSSKFVGHLGFGVTSCDPSNLNLDDIPDEVVTLYDRPEFWAFNRDFPTPEERDTISFMIDTDGKVLCRTQGTVHGTLMHIDISQPLWAAFDVYGNTQVIKILGVKHHTSIPPYFIIPSEEEGIMQPIIGSDYDPLGMRELMESLHVTLDESTATPEVLSVPDVAAIPASTQDAKPNTVPSQTPTNKPARPPKPVEDGECTLCFEKPVNAVFYKCGHMCTCFECGKKLRLNGSPCPMCRAYIKDVIKTFKS